MKATNIAMAFLGGAAVGAVVALLTAPRRGEETRKIIKDYVGKEVDKMKRHHCNMVEELEETLENEIKIR